ncbi:esterase EstP [Pseudomonas mangiferae]|uniref:Autotransporter domain-containing protein n=1 Tax=Pseudomonas mangiferae TaxID=2593654 RepID=A0A553GYU3_9PSED|nr:esterase EstP [Pseudomonas mangiferae]TRX74671.1 autotransporter domain-containing protein [Pseudomonas mangiferae]
MFRTLTPLAAACLLAVAAPLQAAPYSSLIVFGDSLSDAGQLPDAGGPADAGRRFTNRVGPTYQSGQGEAIGATSPMRLGERLGLGPQAPSTSAIYAQNGWADGDNWAVGGYRTDEIYDSITAVGGSVAGTRTRDGYLVDLANRGLSVDRNALFYVNGGGNDFLQGRILNSEQARAAGGRLADSVRALQQAGARYIVVSLLPNVGTTPALSGTGLSETFGALGRDVNDELLRQLSGIHAEIIPLNVPLLFNEVVRDAAQYGLDASQDLLGTCFDGCGHVNPTWGITSATPDPSRLIYNDSVHPTTHVQQIFADYTYSLLSAPWELTLLPEMAHGALRSHQDQLRSQWRADWEAWQEVGQWRSFVSGGGQRLDFDEQDHGADADGHGYSLDLGGSYRLDEAWRVGAALGFYKQALEAGPKDSDYDLRSYFATLFAQYQHDRWWGDLALSGGYLDYDDLQRKFALGPVTRREKGDTDGSLWALSGRLGYDIAQPGSLWHLSPFVSADYARAEVDGYAEKGSSSSALAFDDQTRTSRRLGVGLQGRFQVTPATQLFGEVAREREYADDARDLRMSLTSLPGHAFTLQGYTPDDAMTRASLGISQQLAADLSLRAGYDLRHSDDDTRQGVSLSLAWDW